MLLADTSVWIRLQRLPPERRNWIAARLGHGQVAVSELVRLELLAGARSRPRLEQLKASLAGVPVLDSGASVWAAARAIYARLAAQRSRAKPVLAPADVLIAAAALEAGVPLLHYDRHFERIAALTGQPTIWLAPPGSL